MNVFTYLLLSIFINTSSHLFLKKGVVTVNGKSVTQESEGSIIKAYIAQPAIWVGILLNGLAAFFWLIALSVVDLSYAFPFLSLNYILIPVGAMLLYKEKLSRSRVIGISIICVGILLIALS